MFIRTERLVITELTMDMCFDVHRNSLDEDNRRFVPDEVFETVETAEDVVRSLIRSYGSDDGPFVYPVLWNDEINIGYVQVCAKDEAWEIGYHIAGQYTGKGFATEAVSAFLPVIMADLKLEELFGIVLEENAASIRVLEKCGFELLYKGPGQYQGAERALRKYVFRS